MKLIADSGSTKTAWKLIETQGKSKDMKTFGLNPFFRTEDEIYEEVRIEGTPPIYITTEGVEK